MKKFIFIVLGLILWSCQVNETTVVKGNVHNIAEDEAMGGLNFAVREYNNSIGGSSSKIIESVINNSDGNFEVSFDTDKYKSYTFSIDGETDRIISSGYGLDAYHNNIKKNETNIVQFNVATLSYVQTKIINDLGNDSMYLEFQHVNIEEKNASDTFTSYVSDGSLTKTPSGPRVYKTIKYLNGTETITIDTMDFEPLQTYILEFHY